MSDPLIFQEELVSWLSEEMSHQGLSSVDQLDIGANSPLHLAAKHGHISTVSTLLNFGAQVALKVLLLHIIYQHYELI